MEVRVTIVVIDEHDQELATVTGSSRSALGPFEQLPDEAFAIALRELDPMAREALDLPTAPGPPRSASASG